MTLSHRLKNWRNPHNLTRLHLDAMARRHGFTIGDHSYGRPKVRFAGTGARLSVGSYCSIADGVEILLGGGHRTDWVTTYPFAALPSQWPAAAGLDGAPTTRGDVRIGSDVWIGSQAMILSGVTVGHGAVIGARSVVSRDVAPYAIVTGHPAAFVRSRFDATTVERLLAAAWWDLPREMVERLIPLLQGVEIEALIAAVEEARGRDA